MNTVLDCILWYCTHVGEVVLAVTITAASVWIGYTLTQTTSIWVRVLVCIGCFAAFILFIYTLSVGIEFAAPQIES